MSYCHGDPLGYLKGECGQAGMETAWYVIFLLYMIIVAGCILW